MDDFRLFLQDELVSRCRRNPRYSLRSFAKSVGVNHGILSMILRNKRPLSAKLIQTIGLSLKLDKVKLNTFLKALPNGENSQNKKKSQIKKINQLTMDVFNVVSDWYHDAILELSRVKGFQPKPEFISQRLGITISEARAAIERLERVGLIERKADGTWHEVLGDNTTVSDFDITTSALRNLQRQVLDLSINALENIPKTHRDHTCMTMAINARDLREAKIRIKAFRHDLMTYLQRDGIKLDEVFQLAVSFYPLTRIKYSKETLK